MANRSGMRNVDSQLMPRPGQHETGRVRDGRTRDRSPGADRITHHESPGGTP